MNKPTTFPRTARQGGAILVTCMLLLLVLTILGVTMMRMNRMQERMAGNTRDLALALQGAEAGLRYAEGRLAVAPNLNTIGSLPCGSVDAVCQSLALPVAIYDQTQFDWNANGQEYGGTLPPGLQEAPRYVIEYLRSVPDSQNIGTNDDTGGRDFFQISSRSTGGSGQANTVVQSTYERRF